MRIGDLFWRRVTAAVVRRHNVPQPRRPPSDDDYVRPIPIGRRYPGLTDTPAFVSENTPASEVLDSYSKLAEVLAADAGSEEGERSAPAPRLPEDFAASVDTLAGIARRGPLSMYTLPDGEGFVLDMRVIERLEPRAPFVRVGGIARFARDSDGSLRTTSITFQGRTITPGSEEWDLAVERILVALNHHSTFLDHLVQVHVLGAGTWALCTHLALPAAHPLRILLQPFIVETMRVNNDHLDRLIRSEHSKLPSHTGYPLATLHALMNETVKRFDIRWFDAEWRARQANQHGDAAFPTMHSVLALWRIYREFVDAWCARHLPSVDLETKIWCQELNARIPNGVGALLDLEDFDEGLTVEHVAHLVTVGLFTCSVWHHVVAHLARDHELQLHVMPPTMNATSHPTLGVLRERRNAPLAGLLRYKLVDDSVYLPTDDMKQLWSAFQGALARYEASLDAAPELRRYCVVPSEVPSSVHA